VAASKPPTDYDWFTELWLEGPDGLSSHRPNFANDVLPGLATMKFSFLSTRDTSQRLLLGVVFALFFSICPVGTASPPPVRSATLSATRAANVQAPAPAVRPCFSPVATVLGDRQRMVQVALVIMGLAILILTRGNRF